MVDLGPGEECAALLGWGLNCGKIFTRILGIPAVPPPLLGGHSDSTTPAKGGAIGFGSSGSIELFSIFSVLFLGLVPLLRSTSKIIKLLIAIDYRYLHDIQRSVSLRSTTDGSGSGGAAAKHAGSRGRTGSHWIPLGRWTING